MSGSRIAELVMKLGTPLAEELKYEFVEVEYRKEGVNWVLRCAIDCETGVGIDECRNFSEALGELLDKEDPIPGHYLLEVSSPGTERPLTKERDFIRFTGRKAEIKLSRPWCGRKIFQGTLMGIKKDGNDPSVCLSIIRDVNIARNINITRDASIANEYTIEIPIHMIKKAHLSDIFNPRSCIKGGKKRK